MIRYDAETRCYKHPAELKRADVLIGLGYVVGARFATMRERGSDEERARWVVTYSPFTPHADIVEMVVSAEHRFNVIPGREDSNPMKHTETPWRVSHNDNGLILGASNGISSVAICHVMPEVRPTDVAWDSVKANASHIVRCVNAHEGLVKALRAALPFVRDMDLVHDDVHSRTEARDMIVEALRAAGEEV